MRRDILIATVLAPYAEIKAKAKKIRKRARRKKK
jgi:hypothetical protein